MIIIIKSRINAVFDPAVFSIHFMSLSNLLHASISMIFRDNLYLNLVMEDTNFQLLDALSTDI